MKESIIISTLIIIIYIFFKINKTNLLLIENNGNNVLVRNTSDSIESAKLLSEIINRLYILRNNMIENKHLYPNFIQYINLMKNNFNKKRIIIY